MVEMERIRVLEVSTSYPLFSGNCPAIYLLNLDRELVKRGVELLVVAPAAPGYPREEVIDGVRIKRAQYFWPWRLQALAYGTGMKVNVCAKPWLLFQVPLLYLSLLLHMLYYGRDADIIHCQMIPVAFLGLLVNPLLRKKLVLTPFGTDYRDFPVFFWKNVVERVDAVIAVGLETMRYLEGVGCRDYEYIPTIVNEDEFRVDADASEIIEEFNLDVKGKRFICLVSRLYDEKDPGLLVEAMPHILKERGDVTAFIVGDGILRDKMVKKAGELGVSDRIIFTGARSDVAKFLKVSEVFTALSPIENVWSNTIAEAMFMEVPLILTDAGYTSGFFTHMKDCYLIPPRNPKALADAVCYLLDHPDVSAKLVAKANELLVQSGKSRDSIVEKTISLYERLIR